MGLSEVHSLQAIVIVWLCSAIQLSCAGVPIRDECDAFSSGMRLSIPPAVPLKPNCVEWMDLLEAG